MILQAPGSAATEKPRGESIHFAEHTLGSVAESTTLNS
jgi:hypothetical protein